MAETLTSLFKFLYQNTTNTFCDICFIKMCWQDYPLLMKHITLKLILLLNPWQQYVVSLYHSSSHTIFLYVKHGMYKINLPLGLINYQAMKAMGSGHTSPHILNLGTRWRWMMTFMPWLLQPCGNSSQYPLDRRMGGPTTTLCIVKKKMFSCTCGN